MGFSTCVPPPCNTYHIERHPVPWQASLKHCKQQMHEAGDMRLEEQLHSLPAASGDVLYPRLPPQVYHCCYFAAAQRLFCHELGQHHYLAEKLRLQKRWGVWLALGCAAPGWQAHLPGIPERMLASSAGAGKGVLLLWLLLCELRPLCRSAACEHPKLLLATTPAQCCPTPRPASSSAPHPRNSGLCRRLTGKDFFVMEMPHSAGMRSIK